MRILVTAGPTREFFDSVRFISNPASGRLGYAIAAEAVRRGHEVVLVSGPVETAEPGGVELVRVVTAEEMLDACVSAFDECHACVMTAAVCDYRPARRLRLKFKKGNRTRTIDLTPTEDICARLGATKGDRVVVGFAMEDHDHRANAEGKLRRKQCDAMVLNDVANVGADAATIEVLRADTGWAAPRSGSKAEVAAVVVNLVEELAASRG